MQSPQSSLTRGHHRHHHLGSVCLSGTAQPFPLKYSVLPAVLQPHTLHPGADENRPRGTSDWPTTIQLAELGSSQSCVSHHGLNECQGQARSVSGLGKNSLRDCQALNSLSTLGEWNAEVPWLFPHQKMEQALPRLPVARGFRCQSDCGVCLPS